jgi:hypothetical protein
MTKRKPPRRVSPPVDVPAENRDEQQNVTRTENAMSKSKNEMNAYTKTSYFLEETVGLGRNGKRLGVGAGVGAGTWAAGHYGGVEIINNNMPVAVGGAVAVGFVGTLIADNLFIDDEQEALILRQKVLDADPEVQMELLTHVEEMVTSAEQRKVRKTG